MYANYEFSYLILTRPKIKSTPGDRNPNERDKLTSYHYLAMFVCPLIYSWYQQQHQTHILMPPPPVFTKFRFCDLQIITLTTFSLFLLLKISNFSGDLIGNVTVPYWIYEYFGLLRTAFCWHDELLSTIYFSRYSNISTLTSLEIRSKKDAFYTNGTLLFTAILFL